MRNEELQMVAESDWALSDYGKRVRFLQNGVLGQTWEARKSAFRMNATLGEAKSHGKSLFPDSIKRAVKSLGPGEMLPYCQPAGLPELRELWRCKILKENPGLIGKKLSLPVAVSGLTNGLFLIGQMFLDEGDDVVVHDRHWENYELIFGECLKGKIRSYNTFDGNRFSCEGLKEALSKNDKKALVILNFPNNPTGYSPDEVTAKEIAGVLYGAAEAGKPLVVLCDDAYYGFRYDDNIIRESIFSRIAGIHPNILAIKLDGVTKEFFAGGFRLGFVTFSGNSEEMLSVLETKLTGAARICSSSGSRFAQSVMVRVLKDPETERELDIIKGTLRKRGELVRELCKQGSKRKLWTAMPFNSGYFCCLHTVTDAENLRKLLLSEYGIGIIALNQEDIRIAILCLEEEELTEFFQILDQVIEQTIECTIMR